MTLSAERKRRLRRIHGLHAQGLTSHEIAKRLGIAPSTVRDYQSDPLRKRARKRQRIRGVAGVTIHGQEVESVAADWQRGAPHAGKSMADARVRGKQLRAIIGKQAARRRKGR